MECPACLKTFASGGNLRQHWKKDCCSILLQPANARAHADVESKLRAKWKTDAVLADLRAMTFFGSPFRDSSPVQRSQPDFDRALCDPPQRVPQEATTATLSGIELSQSDLDGVTALEACNIANKYLERFVVEANLPEDCWVMFHPIGGLKKLVRTRDEGVKMYMEFITEHDQHPPGTIVRNVNPSNVPLRTGTAAPSVPSGSSRCHDVNVVRGSPFPSFVSRTSAVVDSGSHLCDADSSADGQSSSWWNSHAGKREHGNPDAVQSKRLAITMS
eukprot:TRINITY_DN6905_c0_g1_i1.p1 TRINITY_DN6905_c0_g1~~TRINITY_DN6905_c0_g1_i1.p1  ORF type:complete len:274 (+),score=21.99 TRINITY_DN6905_c0_g1_i1:48-869(+)